MEKWVPIHENFEKPSNQASLFNQEKSFDIGRGFRPGATHPVKNDSSTPPSLVKCHLFNASPPTSLKKKILTCAWKMRTALCCFLWNFFDKITHKSCKTNDSLSLIPSKTGPLKTFTAVCLLYYHGGKSSVIMADAQV